MYCFVCFLFNGTATTEIFTLSLHDALPICVRQMAGLERVGEGANDVLLAGHLRERLWAVLAGKDAVAHAVFIPGSRLGLEDRKSTRLNSSHANLSYAVFCLKKKKINNIGSLLDRSLTTIDLNTHKIVISHF